MKNNGGPAFPNARLFPAGPRGENEVAVPVGGMSLRAYFAGLAMNGLMADPEETGSIESIARRAVCAADALIEELEATQ